jgi:FMN phosphatase YigB (HAD superfamily)
VQDVEVILFDMNGTLRMREPHEPTQRAAIERVQTLLGMENISDASLDEFTRRQKQYSRWAQENLIQLSEAEIWTQWILPDYPFQKVEPVAAELMLAWFESKGQVTPIPSVVEILTKLKARGYRSGIISNTMSTLEIPRFLDAFGWNGYFDVVILSSFLKIRKPAPEPFLEAAQRLKVDPGHCVYIGNRISKDVVGCKRAGYGIGILIEDPANPGKKEAVQIIHPDGVLHSLRELLGLFPARG